MKRFILSVISFCAAFGAMAQTPQFVSTEASNRNVVLEEFTGVNCGYCPDGHRIAREYAEANPGRVFLINIHQGGFAPLYTTQWGDAIANQTDLTGYPAGTVNRHVFSGAATALSRADFASCGNQIKAMSSFVNVAAQATIDATTRELVVNVEAYYTADAETGMNLINVALLQDSIIGPQSGASGNPSQMTSDGQYIHMHMLRHLLTGQWGDTVAAETGSVIPAGTLVQREYRYTIPAAISNELVKLTQLNLVVFVTRDTQEIYTGASCTPVVSNFPALAAGTVSVSAENIMGCSEEVKPSITILNMGGEAVTTAEIEYSSSVSEAQTYTWTGNIGFEQTATFELPNVLANIGSATTVSAKILSVNGTAITDVAQTASVTKKAPAEGNGDKLQVIIKTDQYAYEVSWKLKGPDGSVLAEKAYNGQSVKRDTVEVALETIGCYTFEIFDAYGDGGATYKIYDGTGKRLVNGTAASYGSYAGFDMKILSLVGIEDAEGAIFQTLAYPNPAKDRVNLEISMTKSTNANISVVDMLGREVVSLGEVNLSTGKNTFELNTSALSNGAYIVKIISNDGMVSKKININR